jgi:anti-sigma-K factor RskA
VNVVRGNLPDRLAAEYVLGTLAGPARRRFEALLPAHPALRRAVASWEHALLPMALRTEAVAPSAATWAKLESRLGWAAGGATGAPASSSAGSPARGVVARGLRLWQSLAAVATVAALVLATMIRTGPSEAPMVIVLRGTVPGEATTLVAGVSPDRQQLSIRPIQPVSVAPEKSLELWVIPKGKAPVSLGVISPTKLTAVNRRALPKDADKLAVTVEPLGGSPTGQPTGPIVFVGDFTI